MSKIRYACLDDINQIDRLYHMLFCFAAKLQPYYLQEARQDTAFLKETILSCQSDIILAEQDEEIVGFALVQLQKTPPYNCLVPHTYVYLIDFVVDESCRGSGIGYALFNATLDWGRQRSAEYLELSTQAENTSAREFYQRQGMQAASITYRCLLTE